MLAQQVNWTSRMKTLESKDCFHCGDACFRLLPAAQTVNRRDTSYGQSGSFLPTGVVCTQINIMNSTSASSVEITNQLKNKICRTYQFIHL